MQTSAITMTIMVFEICTQTSGGEDGRREGRRRRDAVLDPAHTSKLADEDAEIVQLRLQRLPGSVRPKQPRQKEKPASEASKRSWFRKLRDGLAMSSKSSVGAEEDRYVDPIGKDKSAHSYAMTMASPHCHAELDSTFCDGRVSNQLWTDAEIDVENILTSAALSENCTCDETADPYSLVEVILRRKAGEKLGLGVAIEDDEDASPSLCVKSVYIKAIAEDSPASSGGLLRVDDQIVAIDGVDLSSKTRDECLESLRRDTPEIRLLIRRTHSSDLSVSNSFPNSNGDGGTEACGNDSSTDRYVLRA